MLVITCYGTVGFSGSIGLVGVTGLNTLAASMLNLSTVCCVSLVGDTSRLDKSIGSNMGGGRSCCDVLTLRVLVIVGDCTGVACLLKGDITPGLGPVSVIHG